MLPSCPKPLQLFICVGTVAIPRGLLLKLIVTNESVRQPNVSITTTV